MPTIDNFTGTGQFSAPQCITTWTVVDTSTGDDDEVTCTKAAEAGKTHYVTFVCASTDSTAAGTGGVIKADLDGSVSGNKLHFWPAESDGSGSPAYLSFSAPIRFNENEAVEFKSTMDVNTDDRVTFTVGGFTSNRRVE